MPQIPPPPPPPPRAPSAFNPLFAVRTDNGPFLPIGSHFACNGAKWLGKAIASPTAIYLLKKSKNNNAHGGGLAGALVSIALAKEDNLSTCTAEDLPPPIRAQLDPKQKSGKKAVVIIPLSTVSFVKAGGFNNVIKISAGADNFSLHTSLFKIYATPRKLAELGWPLNTELTPADAPVHDARPHEERAKPAQKPLWIRALLIAGAITLVLAVVAIRVALESPHH
ncbi:MAG: hypothetical protein ACTHN5_15455 [Phycisphaerae bacterium]